MSLGKVVITPVLMLSQKLNMVSYFKNRLKVLVAVDGVNAFWNRTGIKTPEREMVTLFFLLFLKGLIFLHSPASFVFFFTFLSRFVV